MPLTSLERYGPVEALRQSLGWLPKWAVRSYAVDGVLIDAGLASCKAALLDFARERRVREALITHHHEDHSGNARALSDEGLPVRAGEGTRALVRRGFSIRFYQRVLWGRAPLCELAPLPPVVDTEHHRFEVLPAPGHCDDQIVFYERAEGWLFSGDAFLAERIKLFRADEDFAATVRSLEQLVTLNVESLFCAHRPVPRGGGAALAKKLERLRDIEGQVRVLHGRGLPIAEIARRVLGPEEPMLFALTLGDVSKRNLVRSILHGPRPRKR